MKNHKQRPVYTGSGAIVPGLTIKGDDASAIFYLNGMEIAEDEADDYMTDFENKEDR